jgi:hyperosmotically inducible protein
LQPALRPGLPSLVLAAGREPVKTQEHADQESAKPMSDAWTTTKVKADLAASEEVRAMDVKVETVNGMVKLTGQVAGHMQKGKAVELARGIKGVKSLDAAGPATATTAKTR